MYLNELERLYLETEVEVRRYINAFYENGPSDDNSSSKSAIAKIVSSIRNFIRDMLKKITAFLEESQIKKNLNKLNRMLDRNRDAFSYSINTYDFKKYADAYNEYISSLKILNSKKVDKNSAPIVLEQYNDKIKEIEDNYMKKVYAIHDKHKNGMFNSMKMYELVEECKGVLEEIQRDGIKSIPDPSNVFIAKAFAKASSERAKMASLAQGELAKAIQSSKVNGIFDRLESLVAR